MPIDLIIPTWNSAHKLERSLPFIKKHLRPDGIIVVDRLSNDHTAALAQEYGATVLTDTESLGSARMKGVRHSRADWVAFVDDDIILPPGFREAAERFMVEGIGAVQAAAISIHEPYRSIHLEEYSTRMGASDHFDYRTEERGFTNATLVRRELLEDLDLATVDTWEDWVITQRVLASGQRWVVIKPFVDHIHDREDLAKKEGWNAAGILNLARTGHMSKTMALGQYVGKILLALKGSIKYTIQMKNPSFFVDYMAFIANILVAPRELLKANPRLPKEDLPKLSLEPASGEADGGGKTV